jgi:hypothetical protein
MITEKDIELLDDYLANKLSETEKLQVETRLKNDAQFAESFQFQQAVIKGVQKARIAELKSMLNRVPVSTGSASISSGVVKSIVGISITAIISTVSYFIFIKSDKQNEISNKPDVKVSRNETLTKAETKKEEITNQEISNLDDKTQNTTQVLSKAKADIKKPINKQEVKEGKAVEPKIEVFDPTKEDIQSSEQPVIEDKPEQDVFTKSSTLSAEVYSKDRKHQFHYQVNGDLLKLYGPFEKELYEVLEFFSNDKRTAFLYFNKTYYSLAASSDKITELKPVMDPKLIQKLDLYRQNQ